MNEADEDEKYAGQLEFQIPEFITVDYDVEARTARLSVQDQDVKTQKEMWGTEPPLSAWPTEEIRTKTDLIPQGLHGHT